MTKIIINNIIKRIFNINAIYRRSQRKYLIAYMRVRTHAYTGMCVFYI